MAQFTLPANSKITAGQTHDVAGDAKRKKTFKIYRWNPDDEANPRLDSFTIDRSRIASGKSRY